MQKQDHSKGPLSGASNNKSIRNVTSQKKIFQIDQTTRVTPFTIQLTYDKSKSKNQPEKGLKKIFDVLQNVHKYQQTNKSNPEIKNKILQQLQANKKYQQSQTVQQKQRNLWDGLKKFDVNRLHPMNKNGNLGTIQRKCKFSAKGVIQYEDGKKEGKQKQIIKFNNTIQSLNSKNKVSKLPWIKQKDIYPYRLVMKDKNDADKAVYFESVEDVLMARIFLVQKYSFKNQSGKNFIEQALKKNCQRWQNLTVNSFYQKLIQKYHLKRQAMKKDNKQRQISINNQSRQSLQQKRISEAKKSSINGTQINKVYFDAQQQNNAIFNGLTANDNLSQRSYLTSNVEGKQTKSKKLNSLIKYFSQYNNLSIRRFFEQWQSYSFRQKNKASKRASQTLKSVNRKSNSPNASYPSKPTEIAPELQLQNLLARNKDNLFKKNKQNSFENNINNNMMSKQICEYQENNFLTFNYVNIHFNPPTEQFKLKVGIQVFENGKSNDNDGEMIAGGFKVWYDTLMVQSRENLPGLLGVNFSICYELSMDRIQRLQEQPNNNNSMNNKHDFYTLKQSHDRQQLEVYQQKIPLSDSLLKYSMKICLYNDLAQQLLIQKILQFKQMLITNNRFSVAVYEQPNSNNIKNFNNSSQTVNATFRQQYQFKEQEQQQKEIIFTIEGSYLNAAEEQRQLQKDNLETNEIQMERQLIGFMTPFMQDIQKNGNRLHGQFSYSRGINQLGHFSDYQKIKKNRRQLIPQLTPQLKLKLKAITSSQQFSQIAITQPISSMFPYLSSHSSFPFNQLQPTQQQFSILHQCVTLFKQLQLPQALKPYLYVLRMLVENQFCNDKAQLIEAFVSVIINWQAGLLENQNLTTVNNNTSNKVNQYSSLSLSTTRKLSKLFYFSQGQIDQPHQKILLYTTLFSSLLQYQCPQLKIHLNQQNIPLSYLCLQYCHYLLTMNFGPETCLDLLIQIYEKNRTDKLAEIMLIFVQVWLCKVWEQQLKMAESLEDVKNVFQNKRRNDMTCKVYMEGMRSDSSSRMLVDKVMKEINILWQRYFSQQNTQQSNMSLVEHVKSQIYRQSSLHLDLKKQSRYCQKFLLIQKYLSSLNPTQYTNLTNQLIPCYKPSPKCLHIYFTSIPRISGSLYIKTQKMQFQCIEYQNQKNRYYIIPNIQSDVKLQFIDCKSNQYNLQLVMDKGFSYRKNNLSLKSSSVNGNPFRNQDEVMFQYWVGLFDDNDMANGRYKTSKDVENSLSSGLRIDNVKYQLNKDLNESNLIKNLQRIALTSLKNNKLNNSSSQETTHQLLRKIKTTFSTYSNKINEYELFLYLLAGLKICLKQKIYLIKQFAQQMSRQYLLSSTNKCFQRMMIWDLIKLIELPVSGRQFIAFYYQSCSNSYDISLPKVLKASFQFMFQMQRSFDIRNQINEYISQRLLQYVYLDLDVAELINFLKPYIFKMLLKLENQFKRKINIQEGQLNLLIRSQGQIKQYQYRVIIKNKQFYLDEEMLQRTFWYEKNLKDVKPRVLSLINANNNSSNNRISNKQLYPSNTYNKTINKSVTSPFIQSLIKSPQTLQSTSPLKKQQSQKQRSQLIIKSSSYISPLKLNQVSSPSKRLFQQQQQQQIFNINICKYVVNRYKKVIVFRDGGEKGNSKSNQLEWKFTEDYNWIWLNEKENLNDMKGKKKEECNPINKIYLNNKQVQTLDFLTNNNYQFKISNQQNGEMIGYISQIGIENNAYRLKNSLGDVKTLNEIYFYTFYKAQIKKINAKLLRYYNYGVFEWQNCQIKGYFNLQQAPNKFNENKKQSIPVQSFKQQDPQSSSLFGQLGKLPFKAPRQGLEQMIKKRIFVIQMNHQQHITQQTYLRYCSSIQKIPYLGDITQKNLSKWKRYII